MRKRIGTIGLAIMLAINTAMFAFAAEGEALDAVKEEIQVPDTVEEKVSDTVNQEMQDALNQEMLDTADQIHDASYTPVEGYWHFSDGVLNYTAQEAGAISFEDVKGLQAEVKKIVFASGPTSTGEEKIDKKYKYKFNFSGFENLEEVVYEAPITSRDMCVIGPSMYKDCPKLKKVTVGNARKGSGLEFDAKAFLNCPSLTEVKLGTGIWQMGRQTFGDCTGLTSFKFSDDVHDVRGDSFWGCTNLTTLSLAESNAFMKVDHNTLYEYFDPYNNKDWGGVTRPGAYITPCLVFVPEGVVKQNDGKYTVTKGIKDIQFWAFMGDKSLTDVTIASTVESIQLEAFLHCDNIKSVTLPKSLKRIGQNVFSPIEPHGFDGDNVNENLTDIYYQGSEEEWKQIELATYKLDEGHINKMTIAGRDSSGKLQAGYEKEFLYNNLQRAGIPANVNIHFNSTLTDTAYTLGSAKSAAKTDEIYQESTLGAADDNCKLEKNNKVWELQYLSADETCKLTLAKGNRVKIPDFAALVSADPSKCVAVNKKGIISAKKDTAGNPVDIVYETTGGRKITLKVGVMTPVFTMPESVSANAVTKVKKLNVYASLTQGQTVDSVLTVPDNFCINMSKVVNKCGADCTLKKEEDGKIHLRAQITKKGIVKIPVTVNGKLFRVKLTIKK